MNILKSLNDSEKKLKKLFGILGILAILVILFEIANLIIVSGLFDARIMTSTTFQRIWLPIFPFILIWLFVTILAFKKRIVSCFLLLLFTQNYYIHAATSLFSKKLISGFLGIIPFLTSVIIIITLAYNLIILIIWLRMANKNYKSIKNYFEMQQTKENIL